MKMSLRFVALRLPCALNSRFPEKQRRTRVVALIAILLIAFSLRLWISIDFPNIDYPDEIYQTIEPAHLLIYHVGIVTWEYRIGCRSWALPAVLAVLMRASAWMQAGSNGYLLGITIFLCLLSLSPVLFAFYYGYRSIGMWAALVCGAASALWFELVYFAPKAFFEVVATYLFLPAVYLAEFETAALTVRRRVLLVGLLCGITIGLRIQMAPAVLTLAIYSCRREWKEKWVAWLSGVLAVSAGFGLLDAFTWSYPFQSTILYLRSNLFPTGQIPQFNSSPWYWYGIMLVKYLGPLLVLAVAGIRGNALLGWLVLAVLLPHSLISHKEYRFIFPALPLILILAGIGLLRTLSYVTAKCRLYRSPAAQTAFAVTIIACVSAAYASHTNRWIAYAGNLRALRNLSVRSDLCGVGLFGGTWDYFGGYTNLHQQVPIIPINSRDDLERFAPAFNFVVSSAATPPEARVYRLQGCWEGTCVYKRPGRCIQIQGSDINAVLRAKNR